MSRTAVDLVVNIISRGGENLKRVNKDLAATDKAAKKSGTTMQSAKELWQRFAVTAGAAGAVLFTAKKAFDFAKEGQQIMNVQKTFDSLAQSVGSNSQSMLQSMNKATGGIVRNTDLIMSANRFLAMGLANSEGEAAKLAKTAVVLGSAMGKDASASMEEFALLLANQSIPRLDTFGISAGKVRERINELKAANKSMTRETAFMIAVNEEAEKSMAKLGDSVPVDEYAEFTKTTADLTDNLKVATATGLNPLVKGINDSIIAIAEWEKDVEAVKDAWKRGEIGIVDYINIINPLGDELEREAELLRDVAAGGEFNDKMLQRQAQSAREFGEATAELTEEQIKLKDELAKYFVIQETNLTGLESQARSQELYEKILRKSIMAQHEWTDAQEEAGEVLEAINFPKTISLFNEELDELGPRLIMTGGRTADQNRILEEAQRNYDRVTQAIHDYQVGLRGFGDDAEDVNERIENLTAEQAHWNRLIQDYSGIQGDAALVTIEATRSQEAINQAFLEGITATEENKNEILGMKIAMGELTAAQAGAIVEQWNMEAAIRAIQAAWQEGDISSGDAISALTGIGSGFINNATDAQIFIDKIVPMNAELDKMTGEHEATIILTEIEAKKDDLGEFQDKLWQVQSQREGGLGVTPYQVDFETNAAEIAAEIDDPLRKSIDRAIEGSGSPWEVEFETDALEAAKKVIRLRKEAENAAGTYHIKFKVTVEGDEIPRQHGGPVIGGLPYKVGEAGPETFVPAQSGYIIPNARTTGGGGGGNVVNNFFAQTEAAMALALAQVHNNKRQRMNRYMGG